MTSSGAKKRTFVYGMDGVVALQQYVGTAQEVRWEHTDPSNASYAQTSASGDVYYFNLAELDPLGSNVGLSNPNYNQSNGSQTNSPQNLSPGGWGYGSWGDPFGGYSCRMNGFEMPCSTVMYALSSGAAFPDQHFEQATYLGHWEDWGGDYTDRNGNLVVYTNNHFVLNPGFGGFGQQTQQNGQLITTDVLNSLGKDLKTLMDNDLCGKFLNALLNQIEDVQLPNMTVKKFDGTVLENFNRIRKDGSFLIGENLSAHALYENNKITFDTKYFKPNSNEEKRIIVDARPNVILASYIGSLRQLDLAHLQKRHTHLAHLFDLPI